MLPTRLTNFALLFHRSVEKGMLLFVATIVAILVVNSEVASHYHSIMHETISFNFGQKSFGLSVHEWINEFLMAIFFFIVGMDIKRELVEGHLSKADQRILPVIAAMAGAIVPIGMYFLFNNGSNAESMRAWAVPAATDIAFALGVFAIAGRGLPIALRVFLTALAIIDDLFAVLIIALFYTAEISYINLIFISICITILLFVNRRGVAAISVYAVVGLVMWYFFLHSGIHSTISGVILGLTIPIRCGNDSPLITRLEKKLAPLASYVILPLFAFANSGISLKGFDLNYISSSGIVLGIAVGLFVGKQLGIFGSVYALTKAKIVGLPSGSTLLQFYAVSVICGIGFTMSLFIGILAFDGYPEYLLETKLGVLLGSLFSLIFGSILLYISSINKASKE